MLPKLVVLPIVVGVLIVTALRVMFDRSPDGIPVPIADHVMLAPSYGHVAKINITNTHIHVICTLSLTDVHVQYVPINGRIISQQYDRNGKFALSTDLNKSHRNEKMITRIQPDYPHTGTVIVYQVAGLTTRHIESDVQTGQVVRAGERLGRIRFGSRVDFYVPVSSRLLVRVGEPLRGGIQPVCVLT